MQHPTIRRCDFKPEEIRSRFRMSLTQIQRVECGTSPSGDVEIIIYFEPSLTGRRMTGLDRIMTYLTFDAKRRCLRHYI